ncbi:hypothetical protein KFK09_004681 [Dendrobium nobile]|uniref:1-acylglycerol-3-phosphate O-acyltransferase n=1 Tax=Dendrobium nobile TaxID=94219 RepID=A0A8T3C6X2_DENNO|nr:hypothetical protein KFK09_004681 [Dendrobium nobile]
MIPKHINADGSHRRHQLTAIRVVRGILCLAVLLTTACMTLIYCAPLFTLLLRLFSIHYSRKVVALLFGAWLSMWPFLFEKINNTKVVFSGDSVPSKERVLLFANHRTEVDWMYLWDLALRKGCLGSIKYVLKSSLMKLPVFGWGFQVLEFISVERKWEIDESMMRRKLSTFKDTRDSLWLAVFPEGTDYTIAYKHRCPTFLDNAFGVDPLEVHIHIRRFSPHEIPASEKDVAVWLTERFRIKDQLLTDFTNLGYFPDEGTEGDLSTFSCLIYVLISAVYLTYITHFDIQPTPILGSLKALICSKKEL